MILAYLNFSNYSLVTIIKIMIPEVKMLPLNRDQAFYLISSVEEQFSI